MRRLKRKSFVIIIIIIIIIIINNNIIIHDPKPADRPPRILAKAIVREHYLRI